MCAYLLRMGMSSWVPIQQASVEVVSIGMLAIATNLTIYPYKSYMPYTIYPYQSYMGEETPHATMSKGSIR